MPRDRTAGFYDLPLELQNRIRGPLGYVDTLASSAAELSSATDPGVFRFLHRLSSSLPILVLHAKARPQWPVFMFVRRGADQFWDITFNNGRFDVVERQPAMAPYPGLTDHQVLELFNRIAREGGPLQIEVPIFQLSATYDWPRYELGGSVTRLK